jgi:3-oxoacyl-[acyl-carrier-protein] synthase II
MADTIELAAIKRVLGDDLGGASMSSTKSAIGHLLGGAGAVEAIFCILAMRDGIVPPTLNLHDPDDGTEGIDLVPLVARKREVRAVLNNSFGFGGTNASIIMQKVN